MGLYELCHKKSTNGGKTWTASRRLTWTSVNTGHPLVAVDSSDTLHVICVQDVSSYQEIFYKKSPDGGVTWASLRRLTWTGDYSLYPALAVAPNDSIHVIWQDYSPGNAEVFYKNSTNGGTTWSGTKRITWNPSKSNVPDITVDLNNKIHVTWEDGFPGIVEIYYKSSTNGGTSWSASKKLTWNTESPHYPKMTVGPANVIHLAWYQYVSSTNPEIFYKSSESGGVTWSPTRRVTWNSRWTGHPVLATDSGKIVHMVWRETISGNSEVFYRYKK